MYMPFKQLYFRTREPFLEGLGSTGGAEGRPRGGHTAFLLSIGRGRPGHASCGCLWDRAQHSHQLRQKPNSGQPWLEADAVAPALTSTRLGARRVNHRHRPQSCSKAGPQSWGQAACHREGRDWWYQKRCVLVPITRRELFKSKGL